MVYYFWTAAEDHILTTWVDFAMRHGPVHLSCHYDGIRVQLPDGVSVKAFARECEAHIAVRFSAFSVLFGDQWIMQMDVSLSRR